MVGPCSDLSQASFLICNPEIMRVLISQRSLGRLLKMMGKKIARDCHIIRTQWKMTVNHFQKGAIILFTDVETGTSNSC